MRAIRFTSPPIRSTRHGPRGHGHSNNDTNGNGSSNDHGHGNAPPPRTDPFFERSPPPDAIDQLLAHLERTEREHAPRSSHIKPTPAPAALRRRTPEELDADRRGAMRAVAWGVLAALIVIACVVIAGGLAAWYGFHAE